MAKMEELNQKIYRILFMIADETSSHDAAKIHRIPNAQNHPQPFCTKSP